MVTIVDYRDEGKLISTATHTLKGNDIHTVHNRTIHSTIDGGLKSAHRKTSRIALAILFHLYFFLKQDTLKSKCRRLVLDVSNK